MPIELFGASVPGPAHIVAGLPNQDAWGHTTVRGHRVVVVADGLGSRPKAQDGSKAAVAAVPEALRTWLRHPDAPVEILLGLVHLLWRARLAPSEPEDAATTCLFAAIAPDGSGLVAQLGDGLVLIDDGDEAAPLGQRPDDSFANQTLALGVTRRIGAWHWRRLVPGTRRLMLCTDGVADDLLPDRYPALLDWLEQDLLPLPSQRRWRAMARELRDWPTPRHTDDKTIAFIRSRP
jgi:serine/threonine protein phosphatase PrpC